MSHYLFIQVETVHSYSEFILNIVKSYKLFAMFIWGYGWIMAMRILFITYKFLYKAPLFLLSSLTTLLCVHTPTHTRTNMV